MYPPTVCPTWDQTVVLDPIVMYGTHEEIEDAMPKVIVKIYDSDSFNSDDFMGSFQVPSQFRTNLTTVCPELTLLLPGAEPVQC